jgi:membrane-bound lytic murein transglycosylase MltF
MRFEDILPALAEGRGDIGAAKRGCDPNTWFNNVEHMTSESIGREPVEYVGNINKYYVACRFATERGEQRSKSRQERAQEGELSKNEQALQAWKRSHSRPRK